jgi:Ca2+-binding RTX toxin-like protein
MVQSDVTYTLGKNVETLVLSGSYVINGTGNESDNTITGNAGLNHLAGMAGHDIINGGDGMDYLRGGAGNDTLTGGNGNDNFIFDEKKNAGIDTITDMKAGGANDHIQFDDDVFTGLGKLPSNSSGVGIVTNEQFYAGTAAHDATDRIIYDQTSGALYYDQDGNGTKYAQVQIALVGTSVHPTLTYTDFQVIA